jgi:ABC-type antimicrobial peptide transport system permease subunit
MALGADRHKVMRLILRQGMSLRLIGIAAGLLISLAGDSRAIRSALRIKPSDPLTFFAVTLFLVAVGVVACLLPARRAASIEPMQALRTE